jgi:peptide/nickel transport system substrate-binding protein/oligopeptide transport system substrate-binding protein
LRINLASEPGYLDPALNSSVDGACLAVNSFVGLYVYDENSQLQPALSDGEPEVSEDGLTYTFKLIESKWSNGEELTANDFVYSWNRAVAPETAADYAYMFTPIATNDDGTLQVEALDDYTLQVKLVSPCAYFLDLVAFPTYLPVYQKGVEEANPDGTTPGAWAQEAGFVSNGAFTLDTWNHEESMVYVKNPYYYRADDVKLEKLEFMLSADDTAIYAAYNAGDLDFADTVPTDEVGNLLDNPEFNIIGLADRAVKESGFLRDLHIIKLFLQINRADPVHMFGQCPQCRRVFPFNKAASVAKCGCISDHMPVKYRNLQACLFGL